MPVAAKTHWGVRTGLARTWMTQKIDLDYHSGSRFGYSIAALADIPFYRRFSFRPEIALVSQGGSFLSRFDAADQPALRYSANHHSLQVSLDVAFNIPITGVHMAVFGGIVPDFHMGGKMKVKTLDEDPVGIVKKDMKSFDLGVNGGICVEYKRIFFSINAILGTLDRRVDKIESESAVYQNNLTFSLGYIFR